MTGRHYWEITCQHRDGGGNGYHVLGVATKEALESTFHNDACGEHIWGLLLDETNKVHGSGKQPYGENVGIDHGTGAVYGIFLDCNQGTLRFATKGVLLDEAFA